MLRIRSLCIMCLAFLRAAVLTGCTETAQVTEAETIPFTTTAPLAALEVRPKTLLAGPIRRTRPKASDARQTNAEVRARTGGYVTKPRRRITPQTRFSAVLLGPGQATSTIWAVPINPGKPGANPAVAKIGQSNLTTRAAVGPRNSIVGEVRSLAGLPLL